MSNVKNKKIAVIKGNLQSPEDKWTESQINRFYSIDNNDYWEEIGQRCSVNTYNFWKDLKEEFKKEFIIIKK